MEKKKENKMGSVLCMSCGRNLNYGQTCGCGFPEVCEVCEGNGNAVNPLPHHECVPCPKCNYERYCRYMGWKPTKEELVNMGWRGDFLEKEEKKKEK